MSVYLFRYLKHLPDSECEKTGLVKPRETQECSQQPDCPQWSLGNWEKVSNFNLHSFFFNRKHQHQTFRDKYGRQLFIEVNGNIENVRLGKTNLTKVYKLEKKEVILGKAVHLSPTKLPSLTQRQTTAC